MSIVALTMMLSMAFPGIASARTAFYVDFLS